MNDRVKRLMKDTGWFALGNFGSKIILIVLVPLYTNLLTTEEYGTIDIVTTTTNIIVPLLTITIQEGVFRYALEKGENKKSVFSLGLLVCLASGIVIVVSIPITRWFLRDNSIVIYFTMLYFMTSISGLFAYFLKGIGKNIIYALYGIFYTVVLCGSNIYWLVIEQRGIDGYFISLIAAHSTAIFFMFFGGKLYRYVTLCGINRKQAVEIIKYSLPLVPSTLSWLIMTSIDKYMLIIMVGLSANGVYGVAHKIPSLIATISTLFISAWQISAVKSKDDKNNVSFTNKVFQSLFCTGFFLTFAMLLVSRITAKMFFAKEFYAAWTMTPCLTVGTFFSLLSGYIGGIFTAEKRSDLHMKSNILAMVMNIMLNYIFIAGLGIDGVAYGTMFSFLIMFFYRVYEVKKIFDFNYNRRLIISGTSVIVLSSIITSLQLKFHSFLTFGICGIWILQFRRVFLNLIYSFGNVFNGKNKK